jgi:hypothetical protein
MSGTKIIGLLVLISGKEFSAAVPQLMLAADAQDSGSH